MLIDARTRRNARDRGKLNLRGAQSRDEAQGKVQPNTDELADLAPGAMRDARRPVICNGKRAYRALALTAGPIPTAVDAIVKLGCSHYSTMPAGRAGPRDGRVRCWA